MTMFALQHPYLFITLIMWLTFNVAFLYARTMRAIMVTRQGWPPCHLDADGDYAEDLDDDV